jgi:transcriptional regulator with XRE-family HTH domain
MDTQSFDEDLVKRISPEIKRLRTEKKLSAQKLADRTAEIGYCVSRATIAELEIPRRKYISIGELLVLAAALDVSVFDLVFPGYGDTEVETLPGVLVAKSDALEGFGGSRQLNSRLIEASAALVKSQAALMDVLEDQDKEIVRLRSRKTEEELPVLEVIVERESVRTDDGR